MPAILSTAYTVGDQTRLGNHVASGTAAFTTGGVATNPTAVTLIVQRPDGTQVTLTPILETTGRYYADYTWDLAGLHWCQLRGTGAVTAVFEFGVWVEPLVVGP